MWPFSKPGALSFRRIDADFAVAGQLDPTDIQKVAEAGFKTILCARPDNEEPGQPSFAAIARAAKAAGLTAVHIPVSGMVGEGQLIRMEQMLKGNPGPIYGYCRSGGRAGSLYTACKRAMS
jgi:uncharacterized protein (TIGR01244 family)